MLTRPQASEEQPPCSVLEKASQTSGQFSPVHPSNRTKTPWFKLPANPTCLDCGSIFTRVHKRRKAFFMLSISANLHPGLLIARVIGTMQAYRAQ